MFQGMDDKEITLVSDLYNQKEFMSMDEIMCEFENGATDCFKYLVLNQVSGKRHQVLIVYIVLRFKCG